MSPYTCRALHMLMLLMIPFCLSAAFKDENLLQNMPEGYKIDFQIKQKNMIMMEMVPQNQTIKNWDEMVTTQIMLGLNATSLETFQSSMQKLWSKACNNAQFTSITKGEENGYPFSIWLQACPLNRSTGKPEFTWFKAIKGNDSFYVVHKAFKFAPSKENVTEWMRYFRSVTVCDTRLPNSPCPKVDP